MAQKIVIARAWCDQHLDECLQSYNTGTGQTRHIEELTAEQNRLEELGYIYTGHESGEFTYTRRTSQPLTLPLDWQMARETKEPEYIQDW